MNITEIKADLQAKTGAAFPKLIMQQQIDDAGNLQDWVSHWDNDNRIRVVMHLDLFNSIKEDPNQNGLALKRETVPATQDRAEYQRFVVITPKNVLGEF